MARFRNQVNKGIEDTPETRNQKPETRNHFMENGESQPETKNQKPEKNPKTKNHFMENGESQPELPIIYSESDMEAVNVAGFKVPYIVREHWKKGCREKRVKLSPMLKRVLVDEFGLPPGLTLDDL